MKKVLLIIGACAISFTSVAFAQSQFEHPVPMEGKDCLQCHMPNSTEEMAADPTAGTQWKNSMHGLNNVRCVTCHGEESTFKPDSHVNVCLACHPSETSTINAKFKKVEDEGLVCTQCHAVHDFTTKKQDKKVHSK